MAALASLIQNKEASPVEVVEAYLQRIDDLDFKFNSFITVLRQRALEEARQAQQEILAGGYRGPMHGIPVGIKDQIWTKGIRTTGGTRILADFVPDDDATVISNLKNAGAILLGKTTSASLPSPGSPTGSARPGTLGTWTYRPAAPAGAPERPRPPFSVLPPWERIPADRSAARRPGAE